MTKILNGLHEDKDGTKRWFKDDFPHRDDGPAIIFHDGSYVWLHNGLYHRDDGPAVQFKEEEPCYYLRDVFIEKHTFEYRAIKIKEKLRLDRELDA